MMAVRLFHLFDGNTKKFINISMILSPQELSKTSMITMEIFFSPFCQGFTGFSTLNLKNFWRNCHFLMLKSAPIGDFFFLEREFGGVVKAGISFLRLFSI